MKICNRCLIEKDVDDFYRKKSSIDGYGNWCKDCNKEYLKSYYLNNKIASENLSKSNSISNE